MAVRTRCGMTTIETDAAGINRRTVCHLELVEIFTATARFTLCPHCDRRPLDAPS